MRNVFVLVPVKRWRARNGLPVECDKQIHLRPWTYFASDTFTLAFPVPIWKAISVFFEGKSFFFYRQVNKRKKKQTNKTKIKPNWVNDPNIFIFACCKTHEIGVILQCLQWLNYTILRKLNTIPSITHFPDDMFLQLDVEWWMFQAFGRGVFDILVAWCVGFIEQSFVFRTLLFCSTVPHSRWSNSAIKKCSFYSKRLFFVDKHQK